MRIGLFGGTFDPIHCGHLDVAHAARGACQLDVVWIAPARVPPHRARPHASAPHRFAMAALAVEPEAGIALSDVDMEIDGPAYTADTLARLRRGGVDLRDLLFVTGADAFRDIESWKQFPDFLSVVHFVVVSRPEVPAASLRERLPALASRMSDAPCALPDRPGILLVDAPTAPVSSTIVRRALAEDRPLTGLVPLRVADYIRRQRLYTPPADAQPKGTA